MSLTTVAGSIKKYAPIIGVMTLIILLLGLIYLRYNQSRKPKFGSVKPPEIQSYPAKTNRFLTEGLTASSNLPQKLTVYKLEPSDGLLPLAQNLAGKLGFDGQPQEMTDVNFGRGVSFTKNSHILLLYKELLTYKQAREETTTSLNLETLDAKAKDFFSSLGFDSNLLSKPQVSYHRILEEELVGSKNPQEARFVKFTYNYSLAGLPIIPSTSAINITLNSHGKVIEFRYRLFPTTSELGQFPIISFDEAVKELQAGKGSLIDIREERKSHSDILDNIGTVRLTQASLGYYLTAKTSDILHPVWVFEGTSQIDNLEAKSLYIVPAIEDKYFVPTKKP